MMHTDYVHLHTHMSFRLVEKHPAPLSLFTKCIQVEKNSSDDGNIARIRKLYDSALREYGPTQPGEKRREGRRAGGREGVEGERFKALNASYKLSVNTL